MSKLTDDVEHKLNAADAALRKGRTVSAEEERDDWIKIAAQYEERLTKALAEKSSLQKRNDDLLRQVQVINPLAR